MHGVAKKHASTLHRFLQLNYILLSSGNDQFCKGFFCRLDFVVEQHSAITYAEPINALPPPGIATPRHDKYEIEQKYYAAHRANTIDK